MCRPCSRCSRPRYAMSKCRYSEQAARASLRRMARKMAVGTATSKCLRLRTQSMCSNHSHIKKTALDPSSARRMRHHRTSINIVRPCSSNSPLNSACHLHHRRRQANTVVLRYTRQPRNPKRTRKWSYQLVPHPTSSHRHDLRMHRQRHSPPISRSCYCRRQMSTLLLHAVWSLC
jgi:hypothetical protein